MVAIFNFGSGTMPGNVRSDIVKSGMVDNVGVAVGIAASSPVVQKLFSLPVFLGAILTFGSRQTSDKVDRIIFMSGMVGNMGIEVVITAPSITVEKLFQLPV